MIAVRCIILLLSIYCNYFNITGKTKCVTNFTNGRSNRAIDIRSITKRTGSGPAKIEILDATSFFSVTLQPFSFDRGIRADRRHERGGSKGSEKVEEGEMEKFGDERA